MGGTEANIHVRQVLEQVRQASEQMNQVRGQRCQESQVKGAGERERRRAWEVREHVSQMRQVKGGGREAK